MCEAGWKVTATVTGHREEHDTSIVRAMERAGWLDDNHGKRLGRYGGPEMELKMDFSDDWCQDHKEDGLREMVKKIYAANEGPCKVVFDITEMREIGHPIQVFEAKAITLRVAGIRFDVWKDGLGGANFTAFVLGAEGTPEDPIRTTKFDPIGKMLTKHLQEGIDISAEAYGRGVLAAVEAFEALT